jgi:hypothetical protein
MEVVMEKEWYPERDSKAKRNAKVASYILSLKAVTHLMQKASEGEVWVEESAVVAAKHFHPWLFKHLFQVL